MGRWVQTELRTAMRDVGYEEGRNLGVEWRWGGGSVDKLQGLAAELVGRDVEIIVAVLNDEIIAAMRATRKVPIVMLFGCAPVEIGLVASLRRPGGNVTGTTWYGPETTTKSLQILKEAAPGVRSVAVLANFSYPGMRVYAAETDRGAASLGLKVEHFDVTRVDRLGMILERIAASRPDALFFVQDPVLEPRISEIAAFALRSRLVSIGSTGNWPALGGLLSYGADTTEIYKRAAGFIDRILRGATPADLPVEQPTKFELAINVKTAKALGITLPQSILARADHVFSMQ